MTGLNSPSDRCDLSSDELFSVLAHPIRRTVLFHLRQHRAATVAELVEVAVELDAADATAPGRVRGSLHHVHLPVLTASGLVTYDTATGVVESVAVHDELGEWLDLAVRREIQLGDGVAASESAADGDGIRVLLTDDEPGLPETIAGHIERDHPDISVTTAASALEAVSAVREAPFDCIVSDYQMPAISGLDFLTAVREEDATIPFIVFTAKGSEEIASRAIATGVTDYVQKTSATDQYRTLVDRIRRAVDAKGDD
ncbi:MULTISPECIES: response regulator [Haloarcula]|uniref:response regulator n=1 Tax=Haloarcula TaxID=2237 RepID=UPI0023E77ACD|nr:response regulator [Halomicroarcula sp. SHR3]